jgi:hypothetical protein
MDNPRIEIYSPSNFIEWREAQLLEIVPRFQRRNVWKQPQRSFLIDTILRRMPVPPLFLRSIYDTSRKKVVREVIDGQQRLRAVLDFIDEKYALSKSLDTPYSGKKFAALTDEQRSAIMSYKFVCESFDGISDREVLEVLQRLNTYSMPLSKQELRNGRFFGRFKQACYKTAYDHLEFWRRYRIFTEDKIARMLEVQLTSELLIAQVDGMQDKKSSIDEFYANYDQSFPEGEKHESRFGIIIDQITDSLGETLGEGEFRRPPFFYTLYCAVYHRVFGLPNETELGTLRKKLSQEERDNLSEAVVSLSNVISAAREKQSYPKKYGNFINACLSQTDNIQPRRVRLATLYAEAFA